MSAIYLIGLLLATAGLGLTDYKYKLAFFYNRRRTLITLAIGILVFIIWDVLGIALGIFFHGGSPYTLGVWLGPEFPIEELFFLNLLCYSALLLYRGFTK